VKYFPALAVFLVSILMPLSSLAQGMIINSSANATVRGVLDLNCLNLYIETGGQLVIESTGVVTGVGSLASSQLDAVSIAPGGQLLDCSGSPFDPAGIGDLVFHDLNDNGAWDSGEPGIDGVSIDLIQDSDGDQAIDPSEPVLDTAVTEHGGAYFFSSLGAGNYILNVTDTGGALVLYELSAGSAPLAIALASGQTYEQADFGYSLVNARIAGTIFNDVNGDGIFDASEPGISGATVSLIQDVNGDGDVDAGEGEIASTVTDGDGLYAFNGLAAGSYIVQVSETPADYLLTTNPYPPAFTLAAHEEQIADIGYQQRDSSIQGLVFIDQDGDGFMNGGESAASGVTLALINDLNASGQINIYEPTVATATTNATGAYAFSALPTGQFIVHVTDTGNELSAYELTTGNEPLAVNLGSGENATDKTFGYGPRSTASIGGFVFSDLNGNGIFDQGEPGIDGVSVVLLSLYDEITGGEVIYRYTVTSGGGTYEFSGLMGGEYTVEVTDEAQLLTEYSLSTGSNPLRITLQAMQDMNTAHFGYFQESVIGGYIYVDKNADFQRNPGECGIEGVSIELARDLDGNSIIGDDERGYGQDLTSRTGRYQFSGLSGGNYLIEITDTGGVLATFLLTSGTNPQPVVLTSGQRSMDNDFGYDGALECNPIPLQPILFLLLNEDPS